jgi:hypothetical protein
MVFVSSPGSFPLVLSCGGCSAGAMNFNVTLVTNNLNTYTRGVLRRRFPAQVQPQGSFDTYQGIPT